MSDWHKHGDREVTLLIRSRAKSGRHAAAREVIRQTFPRIRTEPACEILTASQLQSDPHDFMIYEEWSDRDELERFSATRDYMQEYFARMEPNVERFERSFWVRFV